MFAGPGGLLRMLTPQERGTPLLPVNTSCSDGTTMLSGKPVRIVCEDGDAAECLSKSRGRDP